MSKNKIEIQDIPIALILEQYLEYLERRQRMDLEVASEFAAMAAQLMFIKTRMLLSIEDEEAKSEMAELQSQSDAQRRRIQQKVKNPLGDDVRRGGLCYDRRTQYHQPEITI